MTVTRAKRAWVALSDLGFLGPLATDRSSLREHGLGSLQGCELHLFQCLGLGTRAHHDLTKHVHHLLVGRNPGCGRQRLPDVSFHPGYRLGYSFVRHLALGF
jgi:hypothetical protein